MHKRLGLSLLLLGNGSAGGWTQVPTFPTEATRVTVDVVVIDDKGEPVSGLTREDFVVEENGVAQQVVEFEAIDVAGTEGRSTVAAAAGAAVATNASPEPAGRSFLLVVDDLNLTPPSADRVRNALSKFLDAHVQDGDLVTLAPTAGGAWWSGRMTRDREDLRAALVAMKGRRVPDLRPERMSDHEAMLIDSKSDREAIEHVTIRFGLRGVPQPAALVQASAGEVYARAKERTRQTLRSLERAMVALGEGRGRRAVILASEGFMHDDDLSEFREVREAARRSNAALYFIDGRGLHARDFGGPDDGMTPDPVVAPNFLSIEIEYEAMKSAGAESLAADTGGLIIHNTNDLAGGLGRVARESRTFYLLGYEPKDQRQDRRFRKIEVKVRRPGVKVRARKGYVAGAGSVPPDALRALDAPSPARAIPLRLTAHVLGAAAPGRATVLLTAEADPAALELKREGDVVKGGLESFSVVASRDTGETGRRERLVDLALAPAVRAQMARTWVPVSHAFELPAGRYQASVAVRDQRSGRIGSVRHTFEVPRLSGLRLTTPILTDALQRGPDGAAPVPIPIARRTFTAGSRLVCAFSVDGAPSEGGAPRVAVTYEVRRADGSVVTRAGPSPLQPDAGGLLSTRFSLTLNRPGAYEMRIGVRDEIAGEEATAAEAFVVEPR